MVEVFFDESGADVRWIVRPNQSLSWRAAIRVYVAIASCCLGVAIAFTLHGLWTVLPFAGFEVIVLGAAFYLCLHRAGIREVITFSADVVTIEKGRHEPGDRWQCPRAWAQIRLERSLLKWYPSRLFIAYQGRQVEIGKCLNEEERRKFAKELQQAVRDRLTGPGN